jgi:hypothetical protein
MDSNTIVQVELGVIILLLLLELLLPRWRA